MSETHAAQSKIFKPGLKSAVVRYQVQDVDRAIAFYTQRLGFELTHRPAPVFATVARGDLHLMLSGPATSGARAMPDGSRQQPGGWNRIVLFVDSLESVMKELRATGTRFRNDVETGPGGKQVQVEDPDGNPIELHESPKT